MMSTRMMVGLMVICLVLCVMFWVSGIVIAGFARLVMKDNERLTKQLQEATGTRNRLGER